MSTLFQGTHFLVVENPSISQQDLETIKNLIIDNGGTFIIASASDSEVLTKHEIHHILTADSNFAAAMAATTRMVPVTSPKWVQESVDAKQKRNYRLYAPQSLPIMDRVVLCIADNIPQADRDAMYEGVREFGGQYLDALSRYTTHLVAEDLSNNKSLVAASIHRPDIEIKIVLPQWVGECIRRGHKVDEGPYLLTDPVVLQTGKPNPKPDSCTETNERNNLSAALTGKTILLGSSYPLSDHLRSSIGSLISRCGGTVVSEFSSSVDILVCKYRSGGEYDQCLSAGIERASLLWIFHVAVRGFVLPSKSNLLHYPAPSQPLPQFQGLRISVTGYSGDARHYLAQVIGLLGAEFTKTLDSHNDYLVCAKTAGEKYTAVKKRWPGVTVVNHLWVEEAFAQGRFLEPSQKRYSEIGPSVPLGTTRLDDQATAGSISQMESHNQHNTNGTPQNSVTQDSHDGKFHDITDHQVSEPLSATDTPLLVENENGTENPSAVENPLEAENPLEVENLLEVDNPLEVNPSQVHNHLQESTSLARLSEMSIAPVDLVDVYEVHLSPAGRASRSAKQKASAKLHSDMEDLNKYTSMSKSVRKMRTFMEELDQATPTKKRSQQSEPEKLKKMKLDPKKTQERDVEKTKKEPTHLVAIVTGCEQELVLHRADIVKLSRIGISIVNDYSPKKVIDTIVAPRVLRTEKFLKSLSKAQRIVHPTFLLEVLARLATADLSWNEICKEFNMEHYALDKVVPVKQINEELGFAGKASGLPRLLAHEHGLVFTGVKLNLSANVNGGLELIASILEAHGLKECKQVKLSGSMTKEKMLMNDDGKTIVVAHKTKDKKAISQISGLTTVDWDWCVKSIFNGQLQAYKKYALGK